jgi:hypothetical protein
MKKKQQVDIGPLDTQHACWKEKDDGHQDAGVSIQFNRKEEHTSEEYPDQDRSYWSRPTQVFAGSQNEVPNIRIIAHPVPGVIWILHSGTITCGQRLGTHVNEAQVQERLRVRGLLNHPQPLNQPQE